ncbi:nicotinate phosphoribosyltransferase [Metamycoplasma auris]|uniref:nicotinate phosphoribosyltransferase n=1 Tax=Metamycoplasma auris TaxID=51363 RepID=A0A2W7GUY6_9BACT|nr:nicotinate phosphoribosyltransferase [Metamycoplasma auris]PZW01503.1 nicotinate phosphoribosyltransferase [Metamycoplasma auris]
MKLKNYISIYFFKTNKISKIYKKNDIVTLQFFQRFNDVKLCGINEVINLLKKYTEISKYKIRYLEEGSIINEKEVVLELEGHYQDFGIWEGIIDGILARQTSIATNAYYVIKEAKNKKVVSMADRADHYINQLNDAYALKVGGIDNHSTLAASNFNYEKTYGSMPHALIQMFNGDTLKAVEAFHKTFPNDKLIALVDFNNDVIKDSLICLNKFKNKLWGVRVDTSKGVSDKMFDESNKEYGVTPNQIKRLREALDKHGGEHVKIIVSSGFNAQTIKAFEEANTPVDIYGVGASLLKVWINFSADATRLNGNLIAKVGRHYSENKKLKTYNGENI